MDIKTWFYVIYILISIVYIIRFFKYHHKFGARIIWSFSFITISLFSIIFIVLLWPFLLINDIVELCKLIKYGKWSN